MKPVTALRWAILLVCAGLIASCGGGGSNSPPTPQSPASSAPPASSTTPVTDPTSPAAKAVALFDAAFVHSYLTTAPLMYFQAGRAPTDWLSGRCVGSSGSLRALLDGAPPTVAALPAGNHTYMVSFADCLVDGLTGITLNGTATTTYTTSADWNDVTAQVSTDSMRGTGSLFANPPNELTDVSAAGSGTWRFANAGSETYAPAVGSTLVNHRTTSVITFQGGSFSRGYDTGSTTSYRQTLTNIAMTLNGVEYVLDGTLHRTLANGVWAGGSGEVRVTSQGMLVARIYPASRYLGAEVFAPLETF